jgi:hypothetical protein
VHHGAGEAARLVLGEAPTAATLVLQPEAWLMTLESFSDPSRRPPPA